MENAYNTPEDVYARAKILIFQQITTPEGKQAFDFMMFMLVQRY